MVTCCDHKSHRHDHALGFTCRVILDILNEKEKTNQADFHEVKPRKGLIDRNWEEQSASIDVASANDVEQIVFDHNPEETEGENHKD